VCRAEVCGMLHAACGGGGAGCARCAAAAAALGCCGSALTAPRRLRGRAPWRQRSCAPGTWRSGRPWRGISNARSRFWSCGGPPGGRLEWPWGLLLIRLPGSWPMRHPPARHAREHAALRRDERVISSIHASCEAGKVCGAAGPPCRRVHVPDPVCSPRAPTCELDRDISLLAEHIPILILVAAGLAAGTLLPARRHERQPRQEHQGCAASMRHDCGGARAARSVA
jgi:hypothetical protein